MKFKDFFNSPDKWCQFNYAQDKNGQVVALHDSRASKWCLSGAITKYSLDKDDPYTFNYISIKIRNFLEKEYNNRSIVMFNDNPKTTFEDIRRVLELADV